MTESTDPLFVLIDLGPTWSPIVNVTIRQTQDGRVALEIEYDENSHNPKTQSWGSLSGEAIKQIQKILGDRVLNLHELLVANGFRFK